jgi:septal ring-binding cell division protein DamX
MATTGRTRKTKSVLDRERYTADFTSGQLVIAICSLLVAALLCFLLGVIVGRYERAGERTRTTAVAEETPAVVTPPAPAPVPATPPPTPQPVSKPTPAPVERTEPAEPIVEPVAPPQTASPVQQNEEEKQILIAPLPDELEQAPAPAAAPQPEEVTPTETATPGVPSYGIQLAAFGDMENARKARERLLENTELEADLVQAGQWVRVIIGDYKDRKEADAACAELKQKPGFRDCYVITRPD